MRFDFRTSTLRVVTEILSCLGLWGLSLSIKNNQHDLVLSGGYFCLPFESHTLVPPAGQQCWVFFAPVGMLRFELHAVQLLLALGLLCRSQGFPVFESSWVSAAHTGFCCHLGLRNCVRPVGVCSTTSTITGPLGMVVFIHHW